jgi:hypothetical protein
MISYAHNRLRHAVTCVLGATWQRSRAHWMRNGLAYVPKGQHTMVAVPPVRPPWRRSRLRRRRTAIPRSAGLAALLVSQMRPSSRKWVKGQVPCRPSRTQSRRGGEAPSPRLTQGLGGRSARSSARSLLDRTHWSADEGSSHARLAARDTKKIFDKAISIERQYPELAVVGRQKRKFRPARGDGVVVGGAAAPPRRRTRRRSVGARCQNGTLELPRDADTSQSGRARTRGSTCLRRFCHSSVSMR